MTAATPTPGPPPSIHPGLHRKVLSPQRQDPRQNPQGGDEALSGDEVVGLIDIDPNRAAEEGCGWISFFYLLPACRGRGWAAQLLGHAVWFCETHGRTALRLHVAEGNAHARGFYEHFGFREIGQHRGSRARCF